MFKYGGKFYIAVDLEGTAAVIGEYGKGLAFDTAGYSFACKQAVEETNAAVRALFDNGAKEVLVWDNHGKGYNMDYNALDERVSIVMGAGSRKRFPMIEEGFDGVLLIGYHAYDTPKAVLAHVYSSTVFQYQLINGKPVGEAQIDGAVAGKYGVPVIFASSDEACTDQLKETFENIETVVTKKSLAWNNCISKHPKAACREIYTTVSKAVTEIERFKPFSFTSPFTYEVRYKRIEYAESSELRSNDNNPFERIDAYTLKGKLSDVEDIF